MKDLIISAAVNGREDYIERIKGLEKSLTNWYGDTRIYKGEYPDFVRKQIPYAFKYDLIEQAKKDGYKRIFWLDSIMRLREGKSISDLLTGPIMAFDNLGHPLWKYISDQAVENLGISESRLKKINQIWGGAIGFDFTTSTANYIWEEIMDHINIGSFDEAGSTREGFTAHRHDQAVLSAIFYQYSIPLLPYGVIAARKDITDETYIIYG